jgi:peptide/nickel transport system substrate-binding protein
LRCALLITALAPVVGCTASVTPTASGSTDSTALVLAVPNEPANLNPLAGYGVNGAAKLYDGLLEHQADLNLRPALASGLPTSSADGKSWTIPLRDGVKFSDGTTFDAKDVIATYSALLNPVYASPLRDRYSMITAVTALGTGLVKFELSQPYTPFPDLLVLGILPSEVLEQPGQVTKEIGTGPYQLEEWKHGQSMTLRANTSYFGGAPAIARVTVQFVPDDDARAKLIRESKLDGAALAPAQAKTFEKADAFAILSQRSAGIRAITMPPGNPVTADATVRLALNYAVDRKGMIDGPLAGRGTETSTPMSPVLAEFYEPTAKFSHDVPTAKSLLDGGGWPAGSNGIRMKAGVEAAFTLTYPPGDTVARDLATAFAADADAVGIKVQTSAAPPGPADAAVINTGDPFDPDLSLYPLLHASFPAVLDAGRGTTDPAQRAVAYRKLQRSYIEGPTMVVLASVDHTYLLRHNWTGYQPVVDAATSDATWGAFWNLETWKPR